MFCVSCVLGPAAGPMGDSSGPPNRSGTKKRSFFGRQNRDLWIPKMEPFSRYSPSIQRSKSEKLRGLMKCDTSTPPP